MNTRKLIFAAATLASLATAALVPTSASAFGHGGGHGGFHGGTVVSTTASAITLVTGYSLRPLRLGCSHWHWRYRWWPRYGYSSYVYNTCDYDT